MTFWHWLTTTRYTRRLEQEVQNLQVEIFQLRQTNQELLRALSPALRTVIPANSLQSLGQASLTDAAPTKPQLSEQPLRVKRKSMSELRKELEQANNPEPAFERRVRANLEAIRESLPAS